ncbi:FCD domain protein [compost metagenome]
MRDEAALARAWAEHRSILDAVREGNTDKATALMSAHLDGSRSRLVNSLHEDRRGLKARGFAVIST